MIDPFEQVITNRDRCAPTADGIFDFSTTTQDNVSIRGWARNHLSSRGTLFMLHGFTGHCGNPEICDTGLRLADEFELGLVAYDARHHGLSGDRYPTFGSAEMWDFQAVMTEAEARGFKKPFIAIGDSLGAMTAQRTAIADARIRGAFLMHPLAWPMDALGVCCGLLTPVAAAAIMASYRRDILSDGDIRRHPSLPSQKPYILYIMGDRDHYGWQKTRQVYDHWYSDHPERHGTAPCQEPDARKWFVMIPGATHPGPSGGYHVWHYPGFTDILNAFVRRCLE